MSKTPDDRNSPEKPTTEDLLGYLLGALDESEQERIKRYIAGHPEIQRELGKIEDSMRPLRMAGMPEDSSGEPPGGLVHRTCHFVFAQGDAWTVTRRTPGYANDPGSVASESLASSNWQIWDLTMMMAVAVLLAMIALPAINYSRESARRLACASNLRTISNSLRSYSELNGGRFPALPTSGPAAVAGAYALALNEGGYLPNDYCVICPATHEGAFRNPFSIPSAEYLMTLFGEELQIAQRQLGGSYGWHIGEWRNNCLVPKKDEGSNDFAVMSDAPEHGRGLGLVACHPGNGRNVLFESGRVCYIKPVCELTEGIDDLFHNRHCRLAPGADGRDSVVCESGVQIGPLLIFATECQ